MVSRWNIVTRPDLALRTDRFAHGRIRLQPCIEFKYLYPKDTIKVEYVGSNAQKGRAEKR